MGRRRKIPEEKLSVVLKPFILPQTTDAGEEIFVMTKGDREIAEEISVANQWDINREYIRNFRRSHGIAAALEKGGCQPGAGRPRNPVRVPDYASRDDVVKFLHIKCTSALSNMFGNRFGMSAS